MSIGGFSSQLQSRLKSMSLLSRVFHSCTNVRLSYSLTDLLNNSVIRLESQRSHTLWNHPCLITPTSLNLSSCLCCGCKPHNIIQKYDTSPSWQVVQFRVFMSSLAQEAVEKICQLFQDCSSALQLEVCLSTASADLWPSERIGVFFIHCLVCRFSCWWYIQHFVSDFSCCFSPLNNCSSSQIITNGSIIGF